MTRKNAVIVIIIVTIMLVIEITTNTIKDTRTKQPIEGYTAIQENDNQEREMLDEVLARSGECVYAIDSTVTKIAGSLVELTDCTGNVWLVDNSAQARTLAETQKVYTVFSDRGTHNNRQDDEVLCILAR